MENQCIRDRSGIEFLNELTKNYGFVTLKEIDLTMIIRDYKIINNKVVVVTFRDGSTEKAVCDDRDNFDLEDAIRIIVAKKLIGKSKYYSEINSLMKQIKNIDKIKAEQEEFKISQEKKKAKKIAYKKRKAEKQRQSRIDEMSEAFMLAMRRYDTEGLDQNMEAFNDEVDRLSYMDDPECEPNETETEKETNKN